LKIYEFLTILTFIATLASVQGAFIKLAAREKEDDAKLSLWHWVAAFFDCQLSKLYNRNKCIT